MRGEDQSFGAFVRVVRGLIPEITHLIFVYAFVSALYEAIRFVPPYLVKLIIDNLFGTPDGKYIAMIVAGIFGTLFILTQIETRMISYVAKTAAAFSQKVQERCFHQLMTLPMSWHEKQNTGSIISKVTKAAGYVGDLVWFTTNDIIPILMQIILTGTFLCWIEWRIGIIYILFVPLVFFLIDRQVRKVQDVRTYYHSQQENATRELAQSLYNVQTVKDYVQENREKTTYHGYLKNFCTGIVKRATYERSAIAWRDTVTNIVRASTMGIGVWLVLQKSITPGDLVLIFTVTEKAFSHIYRLGRIYFFMGDSMEALHRAYSIITEQNTLSDTGRLSYRNGDVEFKNVSFDYGKESVLRNLTFRIPEKQITALVGPSGSGKTTLVKLITRHYDPTKGKITIGGVDLRDMPLTDLRKHVAFVSQHTEIFDRTIFENIAYGNPKAMREQVMAAAKAANAHTFINKFPEKYDTLVGEKGVRLSGGQRQRVSIARAILANTDILIFDEATSSLDTESEQAIQKAVLSIRGKTLLIIAHRLSTIQHADSIVVLKDGAIIESGSHRDLMGKKDGHYRRMQDLQRVGELRE